LKNLQKIPSDFTWISRKQRPGHLLIWRCTLNLALRCRLLLAVAPERPAVFSGEYHGDAVCLFGMEMRARGYPPTPEYQGERARRAIQAYIPTNMIFGFCLKNWVCSRITIGIWENDG
jgi:hypothetical protein